jgi:nucleoside-diphosphate-sugar epimerase
MRLLITGAGGYIGSVLTEMALKDGHEVVAFDRFFFGECAIEPLVASGRLKVLRKDIRDAVPSDFAGIDAVMDLAALSNDPSGDLNPALTTSINMQGRGHVARTAKAAGVRRYMLASSCSVYGLGEGTALDEDAPLNPLTEYARSSLGAERATFALADDRFSVTALRNATVFGLSPRMRFDLVVNIMTKNATETGKLTVTGGGEQWRPLVHVRDVAQAFLTISGAPVEKVNGQAFNIGRANYRVREIAEEVRSNLPVPVEIVVTPDAADKRSYNVSFGRAKRVLGFEASRDIGFAVREIYDAIAKGRVDLGLKTVTVQWYRHLLEAEQLVDSLRINGRML